MSVHALGRAAVRGILCAALMTVALSSAGADTSLKEYVGWYETQPEQVALVTWGATGGLRIVDFVDRKHESLVVQPDDTFLWRQENGVGKGTGRFLRNMQGKVIGLRWRDDLQQDHRAARSETYGYAQEEVTYRNGSLSLVGLLLRPRTSGRHAAIAIIHGSGVSNRDSLWYLSIADYLARHGIVVLLPDKRGCGKSGGDWHTATFTDLADDTLAAVRLLKRQSDVDGRHVGVLGISQGGWIAPLAANRSQDIRFVINVSGAAVTPGEQVTHEIRQTLRQAGQPETAIQSFMGVHRLAGRYIRTRKNWQEYQQALQMLPKPLAEGMPARESDWRWNWWRAVIDFDPLPLWRRLTVPWLIIYGARDEEDNVPVKRSVARLAQAQKAKADARQTVRVFAESGHAMGDPKTGWIREEFLRLLVTWTKRYGQR